MLVGDAAEELYQNNNFAETENVTLAPPHLRLQLASSLCYASYEKQFGTADGLNAEYLQQTKAEKDLEQKHA